MEKKWVTTYHQNAIEEIIDSILDPEFMTCDQNNGLDVDEMAMAVHRLQQAIGHLRAAEPE